MANRLKILLFLSLGFLGGCTFFSFEKKKINYFMIWFDTKVHKEVCSLSLDGCVRSVSASDVVDTTFMILKDKNQQISYIPYSRWKASVPRMFEEILVKSVQDSKIFGYFSRTPSKSSEIFIASHIYSFWIELDNPPKLKVGVMFEVSEQKRYGNKILYQASYELEKRLESVSPETYANTASKAFEELIQGFLKDLCLHMKGRGA